MTQAPDIWYVRFPDGRVVRAPTTAAVRDHVATGHIPVGSRVRRSPDQEWAGLDWTEEFADLVQPTKPERASARLIDGRGAIRFLASSDGTNLASRLDPMRLQTVGLRGLAEELVAALDTALSRTKLFICAAAGVLGGIALALAWTVNNYLNTPTATWIAAGAAFAILLFVVAAVIPVTRMTYVELSALRPAHWTETRSQWLGSSVQLLLAWLLVGGAAGGLIWALRWLPSQLAESGPSDPENVWRSFGVEFGQIITLILEMLIWPLAGFTFLLAPIAVIEGRHFLGTAWRWWELVRHHAGRLFLYESAAVLIGLANLAFVVPLALAVWGRIDDWQGVHTPFGFAVCVLAGLTTAPMLSYLATAHVFIYLNLQYEVNNRRRSDQ